VVHKMNALSSSFFHARVRGCTFFPWIQPQQLLFPNRPGQHNQVREMSKYISKSAKKRLVLTTKRARKGFYKGNGATKEGRLNSLGRFIVDPTKRLELCVPDLTGFKVCVCVCVCFCLRPRFFSLWDSTTHPCSTFTFHTVVGFVILYTFCSSNRTLLRASHDFLPP
jgi:hypothetical protein